MTLKLPVDDRPLNVRQMSDTELSRYLADVEARKQTEAAAKAEAQRRADQAAQQRQAAAVQQLVNALASDGSKADELLSRFNELAEQTRKQLEQAAVELAQLDRAYVALVGNLMQGLGQIPGVAIAGSWQADRMGRGVSYSVVRGSNIVSQFCKQHKCFLFEDGQLIRRYLAVDGPAADGVLSAMGEKRK